MEVKLKNVRLSFPDLWEPRAFQPGSKPKYKATFLIPKNDPQIKVIEAAIKQVAEEKWGKKADGILKTIRGNANKFCFQDGDNKDYDGYAGMMAFGASNAKKPKVVNKARETVGEADEGAPYAGCYVNAILSVFAYDNSGAGIAASLGGVQFAKEGDAFSGSKPVAEEDFDDLSDTGEEDMDAVA